MIRDSQAFRYASKRLILIMSRTVQHQTRGDAKGGSQVDNPPGGVLRISVWKRKQPIIVRVIVAHDEDVLLPRRSSGNLNVVDLKDVVEFSAVDSGTEQT